MINMAKPNQKPGNVFTACISNVKNEELKTRLEMAFQFIVDASAEFDAAASRTLLHQIATQEMVGGLVTKDEMSAVYTQRMARKGAPGRDVYDYLFNSAPLDRCPLCGHRKVFTLDHHLPKALYPTLAVNPLNLVPSCSECNKTKLASHPVSANEETLHPYYDNIDLATWLAAEVISVERPAILRFFVQAPHFWSHLLRLRVEYHFRTFKLGRLYSTEASEELLNIRHQLKALHRAGGSELVRLELRERAESCRVARRNGWRTATYQAFSDSDWFCDGGFES